MRSLLILAALTTAAHAGPHDAVTTQPLALVARGI
jgi:hypothetical protein